MNSLLEKYEVIIGLETHIELKTETKIFCSCSTAYGAAPNTQRCPVCTGMPGALPVQHRKAVEYAVKAGMLLHCQTALVSQMDRKNYFYPDLPKAYQISQYGQPLCRDGWVDIETETGKKTDPRPAGSHGGGRGQADPPGGGNAGGLQPVRRPPD